MDETSNVRDPYSPLAQQQAQESIQVQDTSPPTWPVARTQDLQNGIGAQPPGQQYSMRLLLMSVAIVLIILLAVVWVLSLTHLIQVYWADIFFVIFTAIGTVIPLLQLYRESMLLRTPLVTTVSSPNTEPLDLLEFSMPRPGPEEGALVIYAKRALRDFNVTLSRGPLEDAHPYTGQHIGKCKVNGRTRYIAAFRSLPPGPYTAHIYKRSKSAQINIYPARITFVDWR